MLAITNATIVLPDHYIPNGTILIDGDSIADFGKKINIPQNTKIIDAHGKYVGPGLIDIHTHADGETFFTEDPIKAANTLLDHGVTSVLPALYFSMNAEQHVDAIQLIKGAMPEAQNIIGFSLEGPYLNPNFGCNRENNPWKDVVNADKYKKVVDEVGELALVWCVAPEREGIEDFVKYVKREIPEIVFSVAHSEATPAQIEALMPYGLKIGTHHLNATGTLQKYPECRTPCVDETVYFNHDIYAELICDSRGIHVDPYLLRLTRKIKGDDRVILISDAYACDGPVPEGYDDVDDINFDHMGEIAGSKMTLDISCRNMIKHTGASLVDVFKFASYNPSRAVGFTDRGEIAVGKRADLVFVDHKMAVSRVMMGGETV